MGSSSKALHNESCVHILVPLLSQSRKGSDGKKAAFSTRASKKAKYVNNVKNSAASFC